MGSDIIYIHYGDDQFRRITPICNHPWLAKPCGGLWASREHDPLGWKSWCEGEEFRLDTFDRYFRFTLKPGAKGLTLSHEDQLKDLPTLYTEVFSRNKTYFLDFEKLSQRYDAIEIVDIGNLYWPLYAWDCNCILVMNPDIVEVL